MKKSALFVTFVVLALLLVPALQAATWTGWITDAACAAKGNKAEHKGCALRCAERGEALSSTTTPTRRSTSSTSRTRPRPTSATKSK